MRGKNKKKISQVNRIYLSRNLNQTFNNNIYTFVWDV